MTESLGATRLAQIQSQMPYSKKKKTEKKQSTVTYHSQILAVCPLLGPRQHLKTQSHCSCFGLALWRRSPGDCSREVQWSSFCDDIPSCRHELYESRYSFCTFILEKRRYQYRACVVMHVSRCSARMQVYGTMQSDEPHYSLYKLPVCVNVAWNGCRYFGLQTGY